MKSSIDVSSIERIESLQVKSLLNRNAVLKNGFKRTTINNVTLQISFHAHLVQINNTITFLPLFQCDHRAPTPSDPSSARIHVLRGPGSMLKSGISHSKSCGSGRRDGLRKSLDNHVFLLIYSKYLGWKQIKRKAKGS